MKMISAIIRSSKVNEVAHRLKNMGVPGCTAFSVRGYGDEWHVYEPLIHGGHHKLEIILGDDQVDRVVKEITEHAFTGVVGDGVLLVLDLGSVVEIRSLKRKDNRLPDDARVSSSGQALQELHPFQSIRKRLQALLI